MAPLTGPDYGPKEKTLAKFYKKTYTYDSKLSFLDCPFWTVPLSGKFLFWRHYDEIIVNDIGSWPGRGFAPGKLGPGWFSRPRGG
jgi:hypothetical protein